MLQRLTMSIPGGKMIGATGAAHRPEELAGKWKEKGYNSYYEFAVEGDKFIGGFFSPRGLQATEIEGKFNREKDQWEGKFHILEGGNCNEEIPWHGEMVMRMDRGGKKLAVTNTVYEIDREKCRLTGRKDEFKFTLVKVE